MGTIKAVFIFILIAAAPASAQNKFVRKYINHTEVGAMFGRVRYSLPWDVTQEQVTNKLSLTIQMFNGVQFNKRMAAGITLGTDWYKAALINPVAAGIRYDLTRKQNVNIFGSLDAGYGFTWLHDDPTGFKTKGGLMLNPGLGLRCGKAHNAGVTFTISYKRQDADVEKPPLPGQLESSESRIYNRLTLRLGISF